MNDETQTKEKKGEERFCSLCHRSERIAGKLVEIPGNMLVCNDCMQKSFDAMNRQLNHGGLQDLLRNVTNLGVIDLSNPGTFG